MHREASPFLAGECIRGGPGTGVADPAEPVHSVQADQGGGGPAAGSRAEDLLQTGQCCCKKTFKGHDGYSKRCVGAEHFNVFKGFQEGT